MSFHPPLRALTKINGTVGSVSMPLWLAVNLQRRRKGRVRKEKRQLQKKKKRYPKKRMMKMSEVTSCLVCHNVPRNPFHLSGNSDTIVILEIILLVKSGMDAV